MIPGLTRLCFLGMKSMQWYKSRGPPSLLSKLKRSSKSTTSYGLMLRPRSSEIRTLCANCTRISSNKPKTILFSKTTQTLWSTSVHPNKPKMCWRDTCTIRTAKEVAKCTSTSSKCTEHPKTKRSTTSSWSLITTLRLSLAEPCRFSSPIRQAKWTRTSICRRRAKARWSNLFLVNRTSSKGKGLRWKTRTRSKWRLQPKSVSMWMAKTPSTSKAFLLCGLKRMSAKHWSIPSRK
jgi:hypothetical protein